MTADRRDGHPGCWIDPEGPLPRKIGALGMRIERGTSYHGIALNMDVDLADFGLIDPCGMTGLDATSIAREAGRPGSSRPPIGWPKPPPSSPGRSPPGSTPPGGRAAARR